MTSDPLAKSSEADPEMIRLAHVRRESSIKSLGQLCYLVGFFSLLGALEFFLFAKGKLPQPPEMKSLASPELIQVAFWVFTFVLLLNAIGQVIVGYGLIRLHAWARWTVVSLTALSLMTHTGMSLAACAAYPIWGLLSLVIGGAIHGLILYPLVAPGSGLVFSEEYREVIRKTPKIRSRMSLWLMGLIGLILVGIVGFALFLLALSRGLIDF